MTCAFCKYEFCWACGGSATNEEDHFRGRGCGVGMMDEKVKPGDHLKLKKLDVKPGEQVPRIGTEDHILWLFKKPFCCASSCGRCGFVFCEVIKYILIFIFAPLIFLVYWEYVQLKNIWQND